MPTINLRLQTGKTVKYGLVTIFNADGSFNRCFRLTPAQYDALRQKNAGAPTGVNAGERWVAAGKVLEIGDLRVDNEIITVKLSEASNTGENYLRIPPTDYTGVPPAITLSQSAINTINSFLTGRRIVVDSVIDGVLTWRSV